MRRRHPVNGEYPQSVTARRGAYALVIGAAIGIGLHVLDPAVFSWWFPLGAAVGSVFALGAVLRRANWQERNAALAVAAIALVLPVVGTSLLFVLGAFAVLAGYYLLLVKLAAKGEREKRP